MQPKVKQPGKIGLGEKISYMLANMGNIPLMTLLSTFFLIFYTDVVGLDAGKLATLFLLSRIVDGISDPIMGFLLDRFPVTKHGKFRPMLILGTIICVTNYILLWFGAVWSPVGKYVIVYVTYLLLGFTFDIMDISLNSLLPVMTADMKERNGLSLLKMVAYMIGALGFSIAGPLIVASKTLESYYILIFGAMAITLVGSIVGALGVKERVAFKGEEKEKYTVKDMLRFLSMKPVWVLFVANLLTALSSQMVTGSGTYFYTYIMGDLTIMSLATSLNMVGTLPGLFISPAISNKIGKRNTYILGAALMFGGYMVRLIDPRSLILIYVSTIVAGLGAGITSPLIYVLQADNTNYVQYKTGKRCEAAIASLSSFVTKLGQGITGALPGYILAWAGYVANAPTQADSVVGGILTCAVYIPIGMCLVGLLTFVFGYKLDKKELEHISAELSAESAN